MGLEWILVPGICVGLSPVRPGYVGPAGHRRAGRASNGRAQPVTPRLSPNLSEHVADLS